MLSSNDYFIASPKLVISGNKWWRFMHQFDITHSSIFLHMNVPQINSRWTKWTAATILIIRGRVNEWQTWYWFTAICNLQLMYSWLLRPYYQLIRSIVSVN